MKALLDFVPLIIFFYLYKTVDYGANWTKIVTGISNEHFTRAIRADREEKGILYSGQNRACIYLIIIGSNGIHFN